MSTWLAKQTNSYDPLAKNFINDYFIISLEVEALTKAQLQTSHFVRLFVSSDGTKPRTAPHYLINHRSEGYCTINCVWRNTHWITGVIWQPASRIKLFISDTPTPLLGFKLGSNCEEVTLVLIGFWLIVFLRSQFRQLDLFQGVM